MKNGSQLVSLLVVFALGVAGCTGAPSEEAGETPSPASVEGCTGPTSVDCPASSKDTLIIGTPALAVTIDCEYCPGADSSETWLQVYDPLIQWRVEDTDSGYRSVVLNQGIDGYIPWLAESVEVSDDDLTWTVKLREGVLSHAGNELTTADIQYMFERHEALGSVGSFIDGVTGITGPESINIIDKYTWSFTTEAPNPLAIDALPLYVNNPMDSTEVKAHATSEDPWSTEWLEMNEAGFGPYKLVSWEPGQQIVLERFEDYWGPKPSIKRIIYREIPESANRIALLAAGEIDYAKFLGPREYDELRITPEVKVITVIGDSHAMAQVNVTKTGPLADKRVRQALQLLTDQQQIVERVWGVDNATVWRDVVPPGYQGYTGEWPWDYDPNLAKELLTQAGYGDGFPIEMKISTGLPETEDAAVILRDSWGQAGIDVTITKMPPLAWEEARQTRDFDIVLDVSNAFLADAQYFENLWYESESFYNYGGYNNSTVDANIEAAGTTLDQDERMEYFDENQTILKEELPWINLALVNSNWPMAENLEGYVWYRLGHLVIRHLWFS